MRLVDKLFGVKCGSCGERYKTDVCGPCLRKRLYAAEKLDDSHARGVYSTRLAAERN